MSPTWLSINVRARLWFAIRPQAIQHGADFISMPRTNSAPAPAQRSSVRKFRARFLGAPLLLIILAATSGTSWSQATLSLLGAGTPKLADGGDNQSVVLGLKVFSDVPGQVLGCSFYKSPANTGVHVVSLWDSAGKLLATKVAAGETASGKQSVMFASPVAIAANQTFTCGYFAPAGHYAYDNPGFTTPLNVPPLHVPVNGGVYVYGTDGTQWPTRSYQSNYWVDVIFAPSTGSSTWISGTQFTTVGSTASVTWNTAVPSDSQVEYGTTSSYGNTSGLTTAAVTTHSVGLGGLSAGTTYHFRVRSRDSDAVLALGPDNALTTIAALLPVNVSTSPLNATITSGATQQFVAVVSNTPNPGVTWSATTGSINSSGLFTAPLVSASVIVTVSATSQADTSKRASSTLTVNPQAAVLSVSPASLSFSGQGGASSPAPASLSITNSGGGPLTFTGSSDQPWLVLSGASGTAPSTLTVSPMLSGLKAGAYAAHVNVSGGGTTKIVTVALTVTPPPIQHSVALSWKASTNTHVVSYSVYRSTISGSSYGLSASAIGGLTYSDQSVQPGATYYYVVTAVDDQGRESNYSAQVATIIP